MSKTCPNCGNSMTQKSETFSFFSREYSNEWYCEECGCTIQGDRVSYRDCGDDDDY